MLLASGYMKVLSRLARLEKLISNHLWKENTRISKAGYKTVNFPCCGDERQQGQTCQQQTLTCRQKASQGVLNMVG